jgi:hypothetical protein
VVIKVNKYIYTDTEEIKVNGNAGVGLPSGIIIPPGNYLSSWYGGPYLMDKAGLYSLFRFDPNDILQRYGNYRIVNTGDVRALISASTWMISPGNYDEGKSFSSLVTLMGTRYIGLLCNNASNFVKSLINYYYPTIPTRIVQLIKGNNPLNFMDDGHSVLEIKINNHWEMFDILYGRYWYSSLNSKIINIGDYLNNQTLIEKKLTFNNQNFSVPYLEGAANGFHTPIYFGFTDVNAWTDEVFQVPGINVNGKTICYMPADTLINNRNYIVNQLGWVVYDKATWLSLCYN